MTFKKYFTQFASRVSQAAGSGGHFVLTLGLLVVWGILGPLFHWSDTWHIVAMSLLTWLTYILAIIIQASQNRFEASQERHEAAMQAKLDTLIAAVDKADNRLIGLEKHEPPVGK